MNKHNAALTRRLVAGFSLIEVMITLAILGIGFLGLAKMQTAAVSSTQVSRMRSLVAIQASSLVSAMHANPDFWVITPPTTVTITGATVASSAAALTSVPTHRCANACTATQLAATDVRVWADALNSKFSGAGSTIRCTAGSSGSSPTRCTIEVRWTEKYVAGNRAVNTAAAALQSQQEFTLYVEP